MRRYYTPYEVAMHNVATDAWLSFLGGVFDVTKLIAENPNMLSQPLIKAAGSDVSRWFDPATGDVRSHTCPSTNLERPYVPMGRFVHVPPTEPDASWDTSHGAPWWRDDRYRIGALTARTRVIRIKNVLTTQETTLEVPNEETVAEIRERYLEINYHAKSYTWKALVKRESPPTVPGANAGDGYDGAGFGGTVYTPGGTATGGSSNLGVFTFAELDMNRTLSANGVPDEAPEFEDHLVPNDYYVPVLHVHWNDDLTVA